MDSTKIFISEFSIKMKFLESFPVRIALLLYVLFFPVVLFSETKEKCNSISESNHKMSCYKSIYKKVDLTLNTTYQKVKSNLASPEKKELLELQRMWIAFRDGLCEGPMYEFDQSGLETLLCKIETTEERTKYLEQVWVFGKIPLDPSGSYTDGFGGSLEILRQPNNQFEFKIEVVRGPTAHIGEVSGAFTPNNKQSWIWKSNKSCNQEEEDCCLLEFKQLTGKILIKEISCSYFHGARAYFDGSYRYIFKNQKNK
jgi:uncharacterized protein YecT (DUF1311 family)